VGHDAAAEHLAHAAALDRRDAAIAHELDTIRALAGSAGALRERVGEIRDALTRIPGELDELGARREQTQTDAIRARAELAAAEARLAELERSRRRKTDEIARVRSERRTAVEQLADAEARLGRLATPRGLSSWRRRAQSH
jgi:chromosome segregation ATPase